MKKIRINRAIDAEDDVMIIIKGIMINEFPHPADPGAERERQGKELAAALCDALPWPTLDAMRKELKRLRKGA